MSARILVVDDVAPNVRLLEAKLTSEYYTVLTATNGVEALETVSRDNPDLVLLDIMMPGMDGYEVCARMKASPESAHIPVVMVTALSSVDDRVRGLESGADDFLTKPVKDLALFSRVRSLVRLKMMTDELRLRRETREHFGERMTELGVSIDDARLLIVSDGDAEAAQLLDILEPSFTAKAIADPDEAVEWAQANPLDLIILTTDYAAEDVLRMCAHFRTIAETRQLPMLLIANSDEGERVAKALELGATDYLMHPIERNELLARSRTQLRRKRYQDELRRSVDETYTLAMTDALTGLFNRRYFDTHILTLVERHNTNEKPLSIALVDIDHFKGVNDRYGHGAGDAVLQALAVRLQNNSRGFDFLARLGGEEFVLVLPSIDEEICQLISERLREKVEDERFPTDQQGVMLNITISVGTATLRPDEALEEFIRRADKALYQAKNSGRNRVCAG